jgi:MipA family protein
MTKHFSSIASVKSQSLCAVILAVALPILTINLAHAQADKPAPVADEDGFTASFGVGFGRNGIRGTSEKVKAFPLVSVDYQRGAFFAGLSRGIGYNWLKSEALTVSTSLVAASGRREKDSDRFKGLGDVKNSAAANLALDLTPNGAPFGFQAGVTKAFGKDLGTTLNFGISTGFPLSEKLSFNTSLSANYADKKRMQAHYGVTPVQALNSGYQALTAKAGVESIEFGVGLRYALDKSWSLSTNIGANRLQGDAAKSPIFKAKTTATGAMLATYRF